MSRVKRSIIIVALIVFFMLILPLITIHTVKADAGMLVTLLLFFVVHPAISIAVGILAWQGYQVLLARPGCCGSTVLGVFHLYLRNRLPNRILRCIPCNRHDHYANHLAYYK